MTIEIATENLQNAHTDEAGLRREIALLMYEQRVWGEFKAGQFAGMNRLEWLDFTSGRQVPIQYDVEALMSDLKNMEHFNAAHRSK